MISTTALRSLAALFFLVLLGFAALQINDPDPIIWTSYYLMCAAVPLTVALHRFYKPLLWLSIALSMVVIVIYTPGTLDYLRHMAEEPLMQSMNPEKPYIEEARELIGGAIALAIVLASWALYRYMK